MPHFLPCPTTGGLCPIPQLCGRAVGASAPWCAARHFAAPPALPAPFDRPQAVDRQKPHSGTLRGGNGAGCNTPAEQLPPIWRPAIEGG